MDGAELLWFVPLYVALPALLLAGLDRICFGRTLWDRRLRRCVPVPVMALVLLAAGGALLEKMGLAWRILPENALYLLLLLGGTLCVFLTACSLSAVLAGRKSLLRRATRVALWIGTAVVAARILLVATLGIAVGWKEERRVTVEGKTLLEVQTTFRADSCEYYDRVGLLTRGSEPVFWRESPLEDS